jgi:HSP20 family molecular chaperone IbpA
MLRNILLALIIVSPAFTQAQESFTRQVDTFDKIIVSPHINLVLTEGTERTVKVDYHGVEEYKIQVDVSGSTLNIYLDGARYIEKTKNNGYHYKQGIYQGVEVTAYVTYETLEALEVRGEQRVLAKSPIQSDQFKLTLYGASTTDLEKLTAKNFKVVSYGENEINISSGQVDFQKYTLYGSSHIDVSALKSVHSKAKIYGESEILLHASDELDISAFGEPIITFSGNPQVNKNMIVGEARLFKVE